MRRSFGETARSYEDPSLKGTGESTASQTAWGAMGLMAALDADDPSIERAIRWLVNHQGPDGNWEEQWYTGTGFPRVFYLKYHLYRLYDSEATKAQAAQRSGYGNPEVDRLIAEGRKSSDLLMKKQ